MSSLGECTTGACHGSLCTIGDMVCCSKCRQPYPEHALSIELALAAAAEKARLARRPLVEVKPLDNVASWPEKLAALDRLTAAQGKQIADQDARIAKLERALSETRDEARMAGAARRK